MFFYGLYRDFQMKTRKGIECPLREFELGAIERGMALIAFSQIDIPGLDGWRDLICGTDVESLICECNRHWLKVYGGLRGNWEMYRLDRLDFLVKDPSGKKSKELMGRQLTFC